MKPVKVWFKNGRLYWYHKQPPPYTVYVRGIKESTYRVYTVTDRRYVPFDLTDVWIQIRPVGVQPTLQSGDDYCIFSQDRIHTNDLRASYLRDKFRNQMPEQLTARFQDHSNITHLQDSLQLPADELQHAIVQLFSERQRYQRVSLTPTNRCSLKYGAVDEIYGYEYEYVSNSIRPVKLKNLPNPSQPDRYVPIWIGNIDALELFTPSLVYEPIQRSVVFEDDGQCAIQFDAAQKAVYVITPAGSVIQHVQFDDIRQLDEISQFDFDGQSMFVLVEKLPLDGGTFDESEFDESYYTTHSNEYEKLLHVYDFPSTSTQVVRARATIDIDLPQNMHIVQIRMFHGQMLQLLSDMRVQILEPKFYSYTQINGEVVINDTFPQVIISTAGKSVLQRIRNFEKIHTTTDDLIHLCGMTRSVAETPARQLLRAFVDLQSNQHVADKMLLQLFPDGGYVATGLDTLESMFGSLIVQRLIDTKFLPTSTKIADQQLDVTSAVFHSVKQMLYSRYDTQEHVDQFTTVADSIQRPVHLMSATPFQAVAPKVQIIKDTSLAVPAPQRDIHVFKPGVRTFRVQKSVLNRIVHVTDLDASHISYRLVDKKIVLQRYPYSSLVINDSQYYVVAVTEQMFVYQVDTTVLRKNDLVVYGTVGDELIELTVLDDTQLAYQYDNNYILLSRPTEYFYLVWAGDAQ